MLRLLGWGDRSHGSGYACGCSGQCLGLGFRDHWALHFVEKQIARFLVTQHVVDADDAVGPGGAGIVHHGRVRLHPRPAATLGQKSVVLGRHLALEHQYLVRIPHLQDIRRVNILVQCLLNQILRLVPSQLGHLRIEEDQLQVHAGPEHKHVLVQLDLGDGRRGQRVADRHQAQVLDAAVAVAVRRIARVDARLRITGTVDYLVAGSGEAGIPLRQHALHPQEERSLDLYRLGLLVLPKVVVVMMMMVMELVRMTVVLRWRMLMRVVMVGRR